MRLAKFNRKRAAARRGFTLIEILLVVGILVALAAIALPNLIGASEGAKLKNAKIQVTQLQSACELYYATHGSYPDAGMGLASLSQAIDGKPPMLKQPVAQDPWGSQYNYQFPGTRNNTGAPDIWSNGPDRQSGSGDDIGNWPSQAGN